MPKAILQKDSVNFILNKNLIEILNKSVGF